MFGSGKIKMGCSYLSHPGYRVGMDWMASKFTVATERNYSLASEPEIILEGRLRAGLRFSQQTWDLEDSAVSSSNRVSLRIVVFVSLNSGSLSSCVSP